jgi:hypothetical protein
MEDDDVNNAHTWSNIGWQAALLVRKLRNHRPKKARAEALAVREGQPTPITEPNARGITTREDVKSDLVASPATRDRRGR